MRNLTEHQAAFVAAFTSDPTCMGNASASAVRAGYAEKHSRELGRQLLDKPHVRAAVDAGLRRQISGSLAAKAVHLLERVLDDEAAPLKVRVEAAKTILDRAGVVAPSAAQQALDAAQRSAGEDRPLSSLTVTELQLRTSDYDLSIDALRRALGVRSGAVLEGVAVEVPAG